MSELFTRSDGVPMLPDTRPGPCPRPKTSWSTCFLWFMARSCWCPCVYMWIYIYIHYTYTIIHMQIYIYIYILYTVSPVCWNSLGMSKSLSHRSRRLSQLCGSARSSPPWWTWPTNCTSGSLWVKPIMCSYIKIIIYPIPLISNTP